MERSKKQVDLLAELKGFNSSFPIVQKNLHLPRENEQTDLFNRDSTPQIYRQLGIYGAYCFERIAAAMFGGFHHHGCVTYFHKGEENVGYQPDVADHKSGVYIEVKACVWGTDTKLIREQIQTNCNWVLYGGDQENSPRCYYVFFRHNVKNAEKRSLTKSEYLEELVKGGILYGVKVPLAIPTSFFIPQSIETPHGFAVREYYYGRQYDPIYRGYAEKHIKSVSTRFLNLLISHPEETLKLTGFNPKEFSFLRKSVSKLRINKKPVERFPFITIDFKDKGKKWIKLAKERLEEFVRGQNIESLPEFHPEDMLFGDETKYTPTLEQLEEIIEVPFDIPLEGDEEREDEVPF